MTLHASRRRLRATQAVLAQRIDEAGASRQRLVRDLSRIKPRWIIGTSLSLGLLVGSLPQRALVASLTAIAGFTIRLLNTPLGPMAIGAALSRRRNGKDGDERGQPKPD